MGFWINDTGPIAEPFYMRTVDQKWIDLPFIFGTYTGWEMDLIKDRLDLNLGVSGTLYNDYEKTVNYSNPSNPLTTIAAKESYQRSNYIFSIGLGYRFGK